MEPIEIPDAAHISRPDCRPVSMGPPPGVSDDDCGTAQMLVSGPRESIPGYPACCNYVYYRPTEAELEQLRNGGFIEFCQYGQVVQPFSAAVWPGESKPEGDETDDDSNLASHARRELELVGEDQDVIAWYVRVVKAFASFGHSGGSAMATVPVLHELLQFHNLTDLTDDPDEWIDHTGISDGEPTWQNRRRSEAFSQDGGATYYLLSEREAAGSMETTPLHRAAESGRRASL